MTKAPIIIKKYSNRRLYNTQTSTYITLDDVRDMVREGEEFEVRDAKSNEDLTRQILTQIIFEQELNGAQSMLPTNFLKRMISLYDGNMQDVFPHYLDGSIEAFVANQEKIQEQFKQAWGEYNPMGQFGEISRKNVEMMQSAMQMFNPFEYMVGDKKKS